MSEEGAKWEGGACGTVTRHLLGQFRKQLSVPQASDALKSQRQQIPQNTPCASNEFGAPGYGQESRVAGAAQTRATACGTQLDPLSANRVDDAGHGLNKLESCKTRVGARPGQQQQEQQWQP